MSKDAQLAKKQPPARKVFALAATELGDGWEVHISIQTRTQMSMLSARTKVTTASLDDIRRALAALGYEL